MLLLPTLVVLLIGLVAVSGQTNSSRLPKDRKKLNTAIPAAKVQSGQLSKQVEKIYNEPSEPLMNDECPCNPFNIWLDVFFLIDSSSAMTSDGFDCATAFVESVLYRMNVGQAFGQQTRVGIITYGANAKLHYNLSYWQSSNDLLNSMNLPFHDSRGTNIEEGIRLATANFNPPQHRPNAKKVIVIIASAFEPGNYNDPSIAAATFKEDGGIIITVEYVQVHGAPVLMLDSLATPGFELTNRHGEVSVSKLHQLFCKANCFCPAHYMPFRFKDNLPYGGCYRRSTLPAIRGLAQHTCRRHYNGSLAIVESKKKAKFLQKMVPARTSFWIGLAYKDQSYRWTNGIPIQDDDFKMWAPNYPDSQQGDCVKMEKGDTEDAGLWYNDYCGVDLLYVCQIVSCSTEHYCPVIR